MNDSTPRRRRRRRGSGGKKGAAQPPEAPSAASKGAAKGSGRRRSGSKKSTKTPRKPVAVRGEKLSPEETLERMIRDFPPEYGRLTDFIQLCRKHGGRNEDHSPDEFFYFLATSVETLAEEKFDALFFEKYSESLKKIRLEAGLGEDDYWKPDDPSVPDGYRDLLEEFRREKRAILATLFRNFGESETAALVEEDYAGYLERRERGKRDFYARHQFDAVRMEQSVMDPSEWGEDVFDESADETDFDSEEGEEE